MATLIERSAIPPAMLIYILKYRHEIFTNKLLNGMQDCISANRFQIRMKLE
jgi:hypothetical protein